MDPAEIAAGITDQLIGEIIRELMPGLNRRLKDTMVEFNVASGDTTLQAAIHALRREDLLGCLVHLYHAEQKSAYDGDLREQIDQTFAAAAETLTALAQRSRHFQQQMAAWIQELPEFQGLDNPWDGDAEAFELVLSDLRNSRLRNTGDMMEWMRDKGYPLSTLKSVLASMA